MPKPTNHPDRYVPALDGLRTIAVVLVILYHLGVPGFSTGLLGVAVFFTLSGYLITTNLVRAKLTKDSFQLKTFWVRRFRRLLPAVITTLIAVLLLTVAFDSGSLKDRFFEALSALFYVNNWHTIMAGQSYFDSFAGLGPLDHMWSLSIEEQFYLAWPLILAAFFLVLRARRLIIMATLVLATASFGWMWHLASVGADSTRIYEGTDTRAGGLLLGAALAIWLAYRRHENRDAVASRPLSMLFGAVGLGSIIALSTATQGNKLFLYQGGLILISVATVLAIVSALNQQGMWSKLLGVAPMRWIGERSYGIYLWHLPVIAFMPKTWLPNTAQTTGTAVWGSIAVMAISVILAAISWSLLEDPIRRNGIVEPIRQWRQARKQGKPHLREYPGIIPATATVSLAALVFIGMAPIASGQLGSSETTSPQGIAMELPEVATSGSSRKGDNSDDSDTPSTAATNSASGSDTMNCAKVIHVGDSTSIGLFDEGQLPEGEPTGVDTYLDKGAGEVLTSVFGARATTQGFQEYPSAVQSVQQLLSQGQPENTCWVIATGVNDAANYAAAIDYGYEMTPDEHRNNLRSMLDLLEGEKVMWNTVATYKPGNSYYDNENMKFFNKILREVVKDYPNVVIWDWASEVEKHPDWFIPGDGTHYVAEGNAERAKRFASALAQAFPAGDTAKPKAGKVVTNK